MPRKEEHLKAKKHAIHSREPPLPVYVGLNVHTQTRSKKLVDNFYHLGLSVSYSRVDELANSLATSVCDQSKSEGIVCPTNMCFGLFTVGALDNLDHNPSATTAKGSFHGTGISIFQFPTMSNKGIPMQSISIEPKKEQRNFTLPDNFATVPATSLRETDVNISETHRTIDDDVATVTVCEEKIWMEHGVDLLSNDLQKDDYISRAADHASLTQSNGNPPVISGLLPLFYEKAASPSMLINLCTPLQSTFSLRSGPKEIGEGRPSGEWGGK
ncbi:hypothetical protein AC249_AIPGENE7122 [Exaiptasia diaphana]|nr:hypothetical protein AC249_AIPGENE7122 [Exaiptasia diaphana]